MVPELRDTPDASKLSETLNRVNTKFETEINAWEEKDAEATKRNDIGLRKLRKEVTIGGVKCQAVLQSKRQQGQTRK